MTDLPALDICGPQDTGSKCVKCEQLTTRLAELQSRFQISTAMGDCLKEKNHRLEKESKMLQQQLCGQCKKTLASPGQSGSTRSSLTAQRDPSENEAMTLNSPQPDPGGGMTNTASGTHTDEDSLKSPALKGYDVIKSPSISSVQSEFSIGNLIAASGRDAQDKNSVPNPDDGITEKISNLQADDANGDPHCVARSRSARTLVGRNSKDASLTSSSERSPSNTASGEPKPAPISPTQEMGLPKSSDNSFHSNREKNSLGQGERRNLSPTSSFVHIGAAVKSPPKKNNVTKSIPTQNPQEKPQSQESSPPIQPAINPEEFEAHLLGAEHNIQTIMKQFSLQKKYLAAVGSDNQKLRDQLKDEDRKNKEQIHILRKKLEQLELERKKSAEQAEAGAQMLDPPSLQVEQAETKGWITVERQQQDPNKSGATSVCLKDMDDKDRLVEKLRNHMQKLVTANKCWDEHLKQTKKEATEKISRLKEQIQELQTKVHQLNGENSNLQLSLAEMHEQSAAEVRARQVAEEVAQQEKARRVVLEQEKLKAQEEIQRLVRLREQLISDNRQYQPEAWMQRQSDYSPFFEERSMLVTENQVLKQQSKIHEEDFLRERRDRERAQEEVNLLKTQLEEQKMENQNLRYLSSANSRDLQNLRARNIELERRLLEQQSRQVEPPPDYPTPTAPPGYQRFISSGNHSTINWERESDPDRWPCRMCTYHNVPQRTTCELCGASRGTDAHRQHSERPFQTQQLTEHECGHTHRSRNMPREEESSPLFPRYQLTRDVVPDRY